MQTHRGRRLSDQIFTAFNQACDIEDLEIARRLLAILDDLLKKPAPVTPDRRRAITTTVAAHERLWLLTHQS